MWQWDQAEPFGNTVPDENPSSIGAFEFSLRFPGQYFDRETALTYNMARNFDSRRGSYVEADLIGVVAPRSRRTSAKLNHLYAYANQTPLLQGDPTGLAPGDKFPSEFEAATDAIAYAWPPTVRTGLEHGGWIFQNPDCTWEYTFVEGTATGISYGPMPEGTTADYHTHPPRIPYVLQPDDFSRTVDIPNMISDRTRGYLGAPPSGDTKVFTPPNVRTPRPECKCQEVTQP